MLFAILPSEILESRQSLLPIAKDKAEFCRQRFWNQGKACAHLRNLRIDFAVRDFGIKAGVSPLKLPLKTTPQPGI